MTKTIIKIVERPNSDFNYLFHEGEVYLLIGQHTV